MNRTMHFLRQYPTVAVGGALILALALMAVLAPWLGTVDPASL
jgi:peptide/nickel transport system permease protein